MQVFFKKYIKELKTSFLRESWAPSVSHLTEYTVMWFSTDEGLYVIVSFLFPIELRGLKSKDVVA